MSTTDERTNAPRLVAGRDLSKLPIGAGEGFVLSRIDGRASIEEIATGTGIGIDDVRAALEKLATLGAVDLPGFTPPILGPTSAAPSAVVAPPRAPASYDPRELDEPADLPREFKERVLELFHALDDVDYYELLGVPRAIDRKGIKNAYYTLAATFHTDRYFGKTLGVFKSKMEAIFGRVTTAHDTLANKQRRTEYDAFLVERDRTRAFEKLLAAVEAEPGDEADAALQAFTTKSDAPPWSAPQSLPPPSVTSVPPTGPLLTPATGTAVFRFQSAPPASPRPRVGSFPSSGTIPPPASIPSAGSISPDGSIPSPGTIRPPGTIPPPSAAPAPAKRSPTPEEERSRREALARRLSGRSSVSARPGLPGAPAASSGPPADGSVTWSSTRTAARGDPKADPKAATDALKRRYEDTVEGARVHQARRYTESARAALAKDDLLTASNNFRLALKYTDDPDVKREADETNRKARELMANAYLKQANYEEKAERWREAAVCYVKAAEGRPDDPAIAERAAETLRREGRDLHRAARFAEIAVQKNPNHAPFRVTLGHVYLDAGLVLRARSELEQAAKLDPGDAHARELLAQARRMAS